MISSIKSWLILVIPMLFIGAKSSDEEVYNENFKLKTELELMKAELDYYKQETICYEAFNLKSKKITTASRKAKKVSKTAHKGSIGLFSLYKRANFTNIHNALTEALITYPGPANCLITSALRPHCTKSLHSKGMAIDINWDEAGKEMANWLDSSDGITWLTANNLDYYLENISSKKGHPNYFWNPKATGPHIHLYMRKNI